MTEQILIFLPIFLFPRCRSAFIRHSNRITKHVTNLIDSERKNGVEAMKYFLDLADALLSHRNYNGAVRRRRGWDGWHVQFHSYSQYLSCTIFHVFCFLIISHLNFFFTSVFSQRSVLGGLYGSVTWQEGLSADTLDSEAKKKRSRLVDFFSEKRDFHSYRKALTRRELPWVPAIGIFLSDLYSLANSQWDTPSAALIDFRKRIVLSKLIETFEGYRSEYAFEHIPCVQVGGEERR